MVDIFTDLPESKTKEYLMKANDSLKLRQIGLYQGLKKIQFLCFYQTTKNIILLYF